MEGKDYVLGIVSLLFTLAFFYGISAIIMWIVFSPDYTLVEIFKIHWDKIIGLKVY
jgi:hypothetical protein